MAWGEMVDLAVLVARFLVVLSLLVLVHELGHFLAARAFGIKVLEFGFGFPPRVFGFRRGETLYSLNLLPLGGFVKLLGEEDPSDPRSLASRSVLQRVVVLSAGVFMNVLLVVVLFSVVLMAPKQDVAGSVTVQAIAPGSPAEAAGLRVGDVVLQVDGHPIGNSQDLLYRVYLRLGAQSRWTFQRLESDGAPVVQETTLVPRWSWPPEQGPTGIAVATLAPQGVTRSEPPWEAIPHAVQRAVENLVLMKNEVTRWLIGASVPVVAGPIGIAQITDEVADAGILPLLSLIAGLSLTLAVVNILPIPMLDGGRLMFVLLEWVRRGRRVSPEREGLVHLVGFAVLMTLILLISYQDVLRIFRGESLLQ